MEHNSTQKPCKVLKGQIEKGVEQILNERGGGVFNVSHDLPHVMLCNVVCICCLVQQALPFICGQQISINSYEWLSFMLGNTLGARHFQKVGLTLG
jgi:hypothetical protein